MFIVKKHPLALRLIICSFCVSACIRAATAHPLSQGSMDVRVDLDRVEVHAVVANEEVLVAAAFGAEKNLSHLERLNLHAEYLCSHIHVTVDGRPLKGHVVKAPAEITGRPSYELEYGPLPATPDKIRLEQDVLREFEFAPGNRWEATYIVHIGVAGHPGKGALLLTCREPLDFDGRAPFAAIGAATPNENMEIAAAFVRHGIFHILTGYDHLLFVAALLLAVTTLWDLVKVISAFTLAHTITLTLAALDIFRLSGRVVEPMIAASIVFVALQNIFWPERSRDWSRLVVAFLFGLFHGLGFAGGLLDAMAGMHIGVAALAIAAFSLGVEIGHQVVVIPLFGGLRLVRGLSAPALRYDHIVQRYGSAGISAAGLVYLIAALH
jgi:HupE/UreJ protein